MRQLYALVVGAAFLAVARAQGIPIAFTDVPAFVAVGGTYNLTWGGGDSALVRLTHLLQDQRCRKAYPLPEKRLLDAALTDTLVCC